MYLFWPVWHGCQVNEGSETPTTVTRGGGGSEEQTAKKCVTVCSAGFLVRKQFLKLYLSHTGKSLDVTEPKGSPSVPVLTQMNPVYTLPSVDLHSGRVCLGRGGSQNVKNSQSVNPLIFGTKFWSCAMQEGTTKRVRRAAVHSHWAEILLLVLGASALCLPRAALQWGCFNCLSLKCQSYH
jgi:hypothetical protein